jgi:hypothetical protein
MHLVIRMCVVSICLCILCLFVHTELLLSPSAYLFMHVVSMVFVRAELLLSPTLLLLAQISFIIVTTVCHLHVTSSCSCQRVWLFVHVASCCSCLSLG